MITYARYRETLDELSLKEKVDVESYDDLLGVLNDSLLGRRGWGLISQKGRLLVFERVIGGGHRESVTVEGLRVREQEDLMGRVY